MTNRISAFSELTDGQRHQLRSRILDESNKPLTVAIMGQTGVGKSTLLNGLFGANLRVGDIRPTTKIPEPVEVAGLTGHPLTFWDMPGLGESDSADQTYLAMYREKLSESDVVLWALHADSRSTLFDATALKAVLAGPDPDHRRALMQRVTFVLTKADLITPSPWIYIKDGQAGTFAPSNAVSQQLAEKALYYQDMLIRPHGALQMSETYLSDGFAAPDAHFQCDEFHIRYSGFMSDEVCDRYKQVYPQYAAVFGRLADNHTVVPCSARYRYNLTRLMVIIVNKLGENAIGRFQRLVDGSGVTTTVPVSVMRGYGNIAVWNKQQGRKTFDLADANL
jgi:uncharacterized protein